MNRKPKRLRRRKQSKTPNALRRRTRNGRRVPRATLKSILLVYTSRRRTGADLNLFFQYREDTEAKKAEAARKKAERDAQLAEEEASLPSKPKGAGAKSAQKKSRGLDLSQLDYDGPSSKKGAALNASGIDNALDALSLTNKDTSKVERHPERRFKAAYAAFEARRLPEIEQENPGLRRQQRIDLCRKEFDKSEENPFNQVHVKVNATKDEIAQAREQERTKTESRLAK